MYECKILADSISGVGQRLTTFEITYPYIIHAELMTHRMISKNTRSNRAVPILKSIKAVEDDPFIPEFPKNQKGMQAEFSLDEDRATQAGHYWQGAMDAAVDYANGLERLEVHKGIGNRLLGPFQWFTMICTATDWENFFALRTAADAQAEIRTIAVMMQEAYKEHTPQTLNDGEWHLPLVTEEEIHDRYPNDPENLTNWIDYWRMVSVGRCARISYLTHHGVRDPQADFDLATGLLCNFHLTPFEHVARPFDGNEWALIEEIKDAVHEGGWMGRLDNSHAAYLLEKIEYQGTLRGWHSARMDIPNESNKARALE